MERLEDDADIAAAKAGERILAKAVDLLAGDADAAVVGRFEAGDDHQQRRFARPGRPEDGDRFAARDSKVDAAQHLDARGALAEGKIDALQFDDGQFDDRRLHANSRCCSVPPTVSPLPRRPRRPTSEKPHANRTRRFGIGIWQHKVANPVIWPATWHERLVMRRARWWPVFAVLVVASALITQVAHAGEPVLVVIGDSLVAGYGLAPGEAFPEKLAATLAARGQNVRVVNAGVSGDTSAGGLERLDWAVPAEATAAIVELGANDALRGLDPAATRGNLDTIIARLKQRGIAVLIAGMLAPPNLGHAYGEAFGAIYPELAKKYSVALYPFFLDGVAARPELNQPDGMHPTARGVDVIVAGILPQVEALLDGSAE